MTDLNAKIINAGDVEAIDAMGTVYSFLSTTENETIALFTLLAGMEVAPHIHADQDEFVYVLEGQVDFLIEGEIKPAKAGDLATLPRGGAHAIYNNSDLEARLLLWVSPAGGYRVAMEQAAAVPQGDIETIFKIAAENNIHFLPPSE